MFIQLFSSSFILLSKAKDSSNNGSSGKSSSNKEKLDVNVTNNGDIKYVTLDTTKPLINEKVWINFIKSSNNSGSSSNGKGTDGNTTGKGTDNTTNSNSKGTNGNNKSNSVDTTGTDGNSGTTKSSEGNKVMLKKSSKTDPKNLGKNEYISQTKDNKTTIQIGSGSFSDKDLGIINISGVEGKSSDTSTSSKSSGKDSNNNSSKANPDNTEEENNGEAANASTGDGKVINYVSKDGVIIYENKLVTQSESDFNEGKTPSSGGSFYTKWWFWLIVVVALVLIVFIIFQALGSSSD